MSMWSLVSLAQQLARLVPSPSERFDERKSALPREATGCCGRCPSCREFICVERFDDAGEAPCPRCGQAIRSLDPPDFTGE